MAFSSTYLGDTFKSWADAINGNFTIVDTTYALKSEAYVLPTGGASLGGVKNGGNVAINSDGTMTAPQGGSGGTTITKITFSVGDSRWSALTDNVYKLILPRTNVEFINIFKEISTENYTVPIVDVNLTATEIIIVSMTKFAGYVNVL